MLRELPVVPANAEAYAKSYVGKRLAGSYRLDALIGLGGTSSVYRASDSESQPVAVKILYPELLDGEAGERFVRESTHVRKLSHAHVARVLDSGCDDALGAHFFVVPLSDGRDLDAVLDEHGALMPENAVRIALQAASGLSAAHRIGVVHRDVRPGNLLLDRAGAEIIVKVCDFGAADLIGVWSQRSSTIGGRPPMAPDYAAPEQLRRAEAVDERADIWGLGATLYQMLCGVAPFSHVESLADLIVAICDDDVPHLQHRAPWVDAALARAVHSALHREPNLRPATVADFALDLRQFSGGVESLDDARVSHVPSHVRKRVADRATVSVSTAPARDHTRPAKPVSLEGKRLNEHYEVLRLIGQGTRGSVYEVEGANGTRLAAKVFSNGMVGALPTARARFARAARTSRDIVSPNVVRTIDVGVNEELGTPYIVMELLHGVALASVLEKEGALEPRVAVRLVLQAARGVCDAHACGVVHRNIAPTKLFLQIDETTQAVTVKVTGFGVEKRAGVSDADADAHHSNLSLGMLGSVMYRSPEQVKNAKAVDERTDIWSLSVVLWETLSGRRLWGGDSLGELIVAMCTEPVPALDGVAPWVPHDLSRVVHRGLERDADRRPPSMRAFIDSLSAFAGGSDRLQHSQLVAMTEAERGALPVRVNISASAAAGIANLARGGRGGTSLPPERLRRGSARPGLASGTSWTVVLLIILVVGSLSVALGYLLHRH